MADLIRLLIRFDRRPNQVYQPPRFVAIFFAAPIALHAVDLIEGLIKSDRRPYQ